MARPGRTWAAVTLVAAVVRLGGCHQSVAGKAVRAAGPRPAQISARDLLLQDGERTPVGVATAIPLGTNYFTSARPPECSAALLFEGSPLRPAGSSDHAEMAYRVDGPALYAESVDLYSNALNTHDVVWNGFRAVSQCRGDAVGISPTGAFKPMQLSGFGHTRGWCLDMDDDPSGVDL